MIQPINIAKPTKSSSTKNHRIGFYLAIISSTWEQENVHCVTHDIAASNYAEPYFSCVDCGE